MSISTEMPLLIIPSLLAACLLCTAASAAAAGTPQMCFVDPVWDAEELYHAYDHAYGEAFDAETNSSQKLLMDFYAPPNSGARADKRARRPVVVMVHGGSFVGGDKQGC
jgi:acetyl esterase/lipase